MTNLTEKWKKGELPSGRYWVKMSYQGAIIPLYYSEDYGFEYDDHFYDFEEISEVLAEVPSYDGYMTLIRAYDEVTDKNIKLKELLKECKLAIFDYPPYDLASDKIRLQIKIDQVLGEE